MSRSETDAPPDDVDACGAFTRCELSILLITGAADAGAGAVAAKAGAIMEREAVAIGADAATGAMEAATGDAGAGAMEAATGDADVPASARCAASACISSEDFPNNPKVNPLKTLLPAFLILSPVVAFSSALNPL